MADKNGKLHVAMLPWMAFGHIIPFLELAKLIASKGHTISFISTPRNILRLPQIPQTLTPFINFIPFPLPKHPRLPDDAESTKDLPFNEVKFLKVACDGLRSPVEDFLKTSSPDWIICDFLYHWVPPIATQHGLRSAYFSVVPAMLLGFMGSPEVLIHGDEERRKPENFTRTPRWVPFESKVGSSFYLINKVFDNFKEEEDENVGDGYRVGSLIQGCDAVVVRSSWEFEPEWLNLLPQLYPKPVIPAGLLPAPATADNSDVNEYWRETKGWLDKQEKGSVVYIAFGTETKPSQYELTQIALGLELSGLAFYWVIIKQRGLSDVETIELPAGFEERTRGRGVVCMGWAPQFKILSHESVGALLIHSGMSSMVEGIQLGKALVLLPFLFDQGMIASYLVEKKMAYMIPRDELDGSFTPESVAESLSLVLFKEEGKVYREKAKEMQPLFGNMDIQNKYVNMLLDQLAKS